jgi:hypothetical protein
VAGAISFTVVSILSAENTKLKKSKVKSDINSFFIIIPSSICRISKINIKLGIKEINKLEIKDIKVLNEEN